jgi:hypothetical protein
MGINSGAQWPITNDGGGSSRNSSSSSSSSRILLIRTHSESQFMADQGKSTSYRSVKWHGR